MWDGSTFGKCCCVIWSEIAAKRKGAIRPNYIGIYIKLVSRNEIDNLSP